MAYVTGGIVGVVWLWFWLRGNWFAALLGTVGTIWIPLIWDRPVAFGVWLLVLAWPWVPILARLAARRLMHDIRNIAEPADAKFNGPLELQLREPSRH